MGVYARKMRTFAPGTSHEGVSTPKKGLSAALRGAKNLIWMRSPGFPFALLRVHPGLFSRRPSRTAAVVISSPLSVCGKGEE